MVRSLSLSWASFPSPPSNYRPSCCVCNQAFLTMPHHIHILVVNSISHTQDSEQRPALKSQKHVVINSYNQLSIHLMNVNVNLFPFLFPSRKSWKQISGDITVGNREEVLQRERLSVRIQRPGF